VLEILSVIGFFDHNIFGERFEPLAITLNNGDCHTTGFAGVYISDCARFSCVSPADDFAEITVFY
jgi:hypothetical protein